MLHNFFQYDIIKIEKKGELHMKKKSLEETLKEKLDEEEMEVLRKMVDKCPSQLKQLIKENEKDA